HSAFGDLRYLLSRNRVDDAQAVVTFVGYQQQALPARPASGLGPREENEGQRKKKDQEDDTHVWLRSSIRHRVSERVIFTDQQMKRKYYLKSASHGIA